MTELANQPSDNISKRIVEIIEKRQALANQVKPVYQHLSILNGEIVSLEQHRQQLVLAIDEEEVDRKLEGINFDGLKKRIEQESRELEKLIGRLSRPTLNIGVVGRMGQGKSTFLKSLSGLTDNEIPAREGGACTAVRSTICHHDGDTEATVILHSASTFLEEVIGEYYRELNLGASPISLDTFANNPLPSCPKSATHEEMYKRLRDDYHRTFPHYKTLLQSGSPRQTPISKEDIPKYVAQQRDDQNRLTSFEHLAVREVEIRCRFPKIEVNKLGLVDVPGLGDTRVGDEKLILKTLEQEVDVVLFFRKPDFDRYQWEKDDFKLYDLAVTALDNLSRRSFMILNHRKYGDKDNLSGCNTLKSNTQSIKVVDCVVADCAIPNDANSVLDLVLKYLDKYIIEIEEQYARSCQVRLFEIFNSVNAELDKAQNVLLSYVGESRRFESKFQETLDALSYELNDMLDELWKQHQTVDTDFEVVVRAALQACENDAGIPSEEKIKKLTRLPKYKNRYDIVRQACAVELRSHLSKNFLSLDRGLQDASNKLKRSVANVLITKGGLGELANSLGVEGIEFLEVMNKMLGDRQNKLEHGFTTLLDFKMSYGALILRLIRRDFERAMGGVRADSRPETSPEEIIKAGVEVIGDVSLAASQPRSGMSEVNKVQAGLEVVGNVANAISSNYEINDAASVRKSLQALHRKAVDKCKQTLENWLKAPNETRYYMAEEFVDRILYEEGMEEEWRHFLDDPDIRSKVWLEFKQIEDRKQVQVDWLNIVKRVRELNQRKLLEFIS